MSTKVFGKITVMKRNGSSGSQFPVTSNNCTFGRDADCEIRIQLPTVAEKECSLCADENGNFVLSKMNKEGEILINSRTVDANSAICHNDVLTIAGRSFRFEYPPTMKKRGRAAEPAVKTAGTPRPVASERIQRQVSFGPQLSPEQFVKTLPPNTPVKRGALPLGNTGETNRRRSALKTPKRKSSGSTPETTGSTTSQKTSKKRSFDELVALVGLDAPPKTTKRRSSGKQKELKVTLTAIKPTTSEMKETPKRRNSGVAAATPSSTKQKIETGLKSGNLTDDAFGVSSTSPDLFGASPAENATPAGQRPRKLPKDDLSSPVTGVKSDQQAEDTTATPAKGRCSSLKVGQVRTELAVTPGNKGRHSSVKMTPRAPTETSTSDDTLLQGPAVTPGNKGRRSSTEMTPKDPVETPTVDDTLPLGPTVTPGKKGRRSSMKMTPKAPAETPSMDVTLPLVLTATPGNKGRRSSMKMTPKAPAETPTSDDTLPQGLEVTPENKGRRSSTKMTPKAPVETPTVDDALPLGSAVTPGNKGRRSSMKTTPKAPAETPSMDITVPMVPAATPVNKGRRGSTKMTPKAPVQTPSMDNTLPLVLTATPGNKGRRSSTKMTPKAPAEASSTDDNQLLEPALTPGTCRGQSSTKLVTPKAVAESPTSSGKSGLTPGETRGNSTKNATPLTLEKTAPTIAGTVPSTPALTPGNMKRLSGVKGVTSNLDGTMPVKPAQTPGSKSRRSSSKVAPKPEGFVENIQNPEDTLPIEAIPAPGNAKRQSSVVAVIPDVKAEVTPGRKGGRSVANVATPSAATELANVDDTLPVEPSSGKKVKRGRIGASEVDKQAPDTPAPMILEVKRGPAVRVGPVLKPTRTSPAKTAKTATPAAKKGMSMDESDALTPSTTHSCVQGRKSVGETPGSAKSSPVVNDGTLTTANDQTPTTARGRTPGRKSVGNTPKTAQQSPINGGEIPFFTVEIDMATPARTPGRESVGQALDSASNASAITDNGVDTPGVRMVEVDISTPTPGRKSIGEPPKLMGETPSAATPGGSARKKARVGSSDTRSPVLGRNIRKTPKSAGRTPRPSTPGRSPSRSIRKTPRVVTPARLAAFSAKATAARSAAKRRKSGVTLWSEIVRRNANKHTEKGQKEAQDSKPVKRGRKLVPKTPQQLRALRHVDSPATIYIGRRERRRDDLTPVSYNMDGEYSSEESFTESEEQKIVPKPDLATRCLLRKEKYPPVEENYGMKRLLKTPRQKIEGQEVEGQLGIARMVKTPKVKGQQITEKLGTKRLLQTPKEKVKGEEVESHFGTKRLLQTPKERVKGEPVTEKLGTKRLLQTPKDKVKGQAVESHFGTKRLMQTPKERVASEPLTNNYGISQLVKTPRQKVAPVEKDLGIKLLFGSPRERGVPVSKHFGTKRLLHSPKKRSRAQPVNVDFGFENLFAEDDVMQEKIAENDNHQGSTAADDLQGRATTSQEQNTDVMAHEGDTGAKSSAGEGKRVNRSRSRPATRKSAEAKVEKPVRGRRKLDADVKPKLEAIKEQDESAAAREASVSKRAATSVESEVSKPAGTVKRVAFEGSAVGSQGAVGAKDPKTSVRGKKTTKTTASDEPQTMPKRSSRGKKPATAVAPQQAKASKLDAALEITPPMSKRSYRARNAAVSVEDSEQATAPKRSARGKKVASVKVPEEVAAPVAITVREETSTRGKKVATAGQTSVPKRSARGKKISAAAASEQAVAPTTAAQTSVSKGSTRGKSSIALAPEKAVALEAATVTSSDNAKSSGTVTLAPKRSTRGRKVSGSDEGNQPEKPKRSTRRRGTTTLESASTAASEKATAPAPAASKRSTRGKKVSEDEDKVQTELETPLEAPKKSSRKRRVASSSDEQTTVAPKRLVRGVKAAESRIEPSATEEMEPTAPKSQALDKASSANVVENQSTVKQARSSRKRKADAVAPLTAPKQPNKDKKNMVVKDVPVVEKRTARAASKPAVVPKEAVIRKSTRARKAKVSQ